MLFLLLLGFFWVTTDGLDQSVNGQTQQQVYYVEILIQFLYYLIINLQGTVLPINAG